MEMKTIELKAKLKGKSFSSLSKEFSELGFSSISVKKNALALVKDTGKDLEGKPHKDYEILLEKNKVIFKYSVMTPSEELRRRLEVLPVFLSVLTIINSSYIIDLLPVYEEMDKAIKDMTSLVSREGIDYTAEISSLKIKNDSLKRKYDELVSSSEENARILLECERRRDDLNRRVDSLEGMSDELLKEKLFKWIKIHNGTVSIDDFSSANKISPSRTEEGLNLLIREGYIKRKIK
ncbi:hypothetical protein JXB01_04820 [Candidatus Micrarchaeota archaeon]|nr:hypothetical protein [Candidatus Micrarchaeota archaeon]